MSTRKGPEVLTVVRCNGCEFLRSETEYGSNDAEWVEYECSETAERLPDPWSAVGKRCPYRPEGM